MYKPHWIWILLLMVMTQVSYGQDLPRHPGAPPLPPTPPAPPARAQQAPAQQLPQEQAAPEGRTEASPTELTWFDDPPGNKTIFVRGGGRYLYLRDFVEQNKTGGGTKEESVEAGEVFGTFGFTRQISEGTGGYISLGLQANFRIRDDDEIEDNEIDRLILPEAVLNTEEYHGEFLVDFHGKPNPRGNNLLYYKVTLGLGAGIRERHDRTSMFWSTGWIELAYRFSGTTSGIFLQADGEFALGRHANRIYRGNVRMGPRFTNPDFFISEYRLYAWGQGGTEEVNEEENNVNLKLREEYIIIGAGASIEFWDAISIWVEGGYVLEYDVRVRDGPGETLKANGGGIAQARFVLRF